MSRWKGITDPEDVEYDADDKTINILYETDRFGNNYIQVPISFILDAIKNHLTE